MNLLPEPGMTTALSTAALLGTLFLQFTLISLLAFGGGQAVLPLIERESVAQAGWLTPSAFTAAVGVGYLIPGPVTTMAAFVGYMAGGLLGGLAATLGMFTAPMLLAMWAAAGVQRMAGNRWVRAFGAGAAPAIVGLLGATLYHLARHVVTTGWLASIALVSLLLAAATKISPVWLLLGGATIGWAVSFLH